MKSVKILQSREMLSPTEKHYEIVCEAVSRLAARAVNRRGLSVQDITPRIANALDKYLLRGDADASRDDITRFVEEIKIDDLCLILACENGDEGAWSELLESYDATVKSAARRLARGADEADDLASSIWAELYGLRADTEGRRKGKLSYYSGRGSLAGWLRAVVGQLAIDEFRRQARYVQIEDAREFENLAEESSETPAGEAFGRRSDDPETLFIEKEASGDVALALRAAIDRLDAEDRLILQLYYFDGLKLKEIAATFGYHEATASRKISRLHSEIRKSVENELGERHGWNETEIKRHLAETATKLGISVERLFAVLLAAAILQEFML